MDSQSTKTRSLQAFVIRLAACILALTVSGMYARAQMDQGTITGVVEDSTGAVIPNAQVTLKSTETGLTLHAKTDASGIYNFSPVKIGDYSVTAQAPGFKTTTQLHVHLNLQQRLNVVLKLAPGEVSQTVEVNTTPPLLDTQQGSVGQVVSTEAINETPLNGRNWVYIAQLTAGVAPATGSRGQGTGDFSANGQRAEQNNFILDGIDNNVNVIDFENGASYLVKPPPDALAEFSLDTNSYSAEFGHSAGAVMNASIKAGTNNLHGDVWEYFRNSALDARDFNALTIPEYRENQFGATLGGPILRNKLFFFGDVEANRIVQGQPTTATVPTPLMRQGDFSELLNTSLTGSAKPVQLYEPNSGGATLLTCNGNNNVFCSSQINAIGQRILNLYPLPNAANGSTVNNYTTNLKVRSNTAQWDARMDWNISSKDQAYSRFSYQHVTGGTDPLLGNILDGSPKFTQAANNSTVGESFMASETHIFNPSFANEFRLGYNYGDFGLLQVNYNTNLAAKLGMGGVPPVTGDGYLFNGGLPRGYMTGITAWGTSGYDPSVEHQNVYQILDNVTKIAGNHSLKFGVSLQSIRFGTLQSPGDPRGGYYYTGYYTSSPGVSFTGFGVADLLADQNNGPDLSTEFSAQQSRWYRAAYAEDDWRVNQRLTLNLGLRYDYYQPYVEVGGRQANFYPTGPLGPETGAGVYLIPEKVQNSYPLSATFLNELTASNVTVKYVSNPSLITGQLTNFAPRLGFALSATPRTVVRGGYGIFYGALQSQGGATLSYNYPFQYSDNFPAPSCASNNCPSSGVSLENGFTNQFAAGLGNSVSFPGLTGSAPQAKTPYAIDYNLGIEQSLSTNMVATISYVGDRSRHLQSYTNDNLSAALVNPAISTQSVVPFPTLGGADFMNFNGISDYNALQTKLQKRLAHGVNFLATYTWSHSLDDAPPLLNNGATGYRNNILIPIIDDYANSPFDVRHRVTFNGYYELPVGLGRDYLNHSRTLDYLIGGWASSLTFAAQSGSPITISPNISIAHGGTARAILVRDPFALGGTPDSSNPSITCAAHTRTLKNWYNPCAFANPLPGNDIPKTGSGSQVTGTATAMQYLGGKGYQITGPGYNQVSMSLFKDFITLREQRLQFRSDIFNVLNTPTYGNPSVTNDNSNGGAITGARSIQNFTPNARFFQFSLKYIF